MQFKLTSNVVFEAENVEDALQVVQEHLLAVLENTQEGQTGYEYIRPISGAMQLETSDKVYVLNESNT